jgi:hypothetical protein
VELRTPSARGLRRPLCQSQQSWQRWQPRASISLWWIARDSAGHVRASGRSLSRLLACWTMLAALGPCASWTSRRSPACIRPLRRRWHSIVFTFVGLGPARCGRVLRAASPRSTHFASAGSVRYSRGATRTKAAHCAFPILRRCHVRVGAVSLPGPQVGCGTLIPRNKRPIDFLSTTGACPQQSWHGLDRCLAGHSQLSIAQSQVRPRLMAHPLAWPPRRAFSTPLRTLALGKSGQLE